MRQRLLWLAAGLLSIALSLAIFLPASWLALFVEKQSQGRITLGDVEGSFWRGSAFIGGAASHSGPVTPLFAGRFSWKISPWLVLGQVHAEIENPASLSGPVTVNGNLTQWQISPASLVLPSARLEGLGAPLNTIGPSGKLRLSWNGMQVLRQGNGLEVAGGMQLEMSEMASRLSPVKPLGSYSLALDWHGNAAQLSLQTQQGPMMLSGSGHLQQGRLQFSGKAWAQAGQEEKLANLLNLLGQRRRDGDHDVIALEFK